MRRDGLRRDAHFGGRAGHHRLVGVLDLELDAVCSRRPVGFGRHVAHDSLELLAGNQLRGAARTDPQIVELPLGDVAGHQDRIELDDACDLLALGDEIADLHRACMQHTVEGCHQHAVAYLDLDALDHGPRGFEIGARLGDVGLGLEVLLLQTLGRVVLDLALIDQRLRLLQARGEIAHVEPNDHVIFANGSAAFCADGDDATVDLGAQGDAARRLGLAVDDHVAGHRLGFEDTHAHARDRWPIHARPFERRIPRGARGPGSRQQPQCESRGDAQRDE